MRAFSLWCAAGFTALLVAASVQAGAADTVVTYQGRLRSAGLPANGTFTMSFTLFDAPVGGTQIGSTITPFGGVAATGGVFTVNLDFGNQAFNNHDRYLQIVVNGTTLTPRQLIARAPHAIATRGLFVGPTETVGVGIETPNPNVQMDVRSSRVVALNVQNSSTSGQAVSGFASSPTGTTYGLYGLNDSPDGRGVFGWARNANVGDSAGVYGQNDGAGGAGVKGLGYHGVFGESSAEMGAGVYGRSAADNGTVWGVFGYAQTETGIGVGGLSLGPDGSGVRGEGVTGVSGWSNTAGGVGVDGEITETVGIAAVRGTALATTGDTRGVLGISNSSTGTGVRGEGRMGVHGLSDDSAGIGIQGEVSSTGAVAAVRGIATATSGGAAGVAGATASAAGWDFIANGAGMDYGTVSSIRWKRNLQAIEYPLDKIDQLRGLYYDWDDAHGGKRHDIGMIAEEVGQVVPEIVGYEANGVDAIGMDYSKLTPLLVEAVKALRAEKDAQIEDLQQENSVLRARLERIEALLGEAPVSAGAR
ncbi:MAG: tail fiber domain-containing protein [Phycisphaerales bacterium]|nr:tail fiber domain-containing protein [Phycisphaerales bacterium]